ncbi:hypothetical protein [Devosia lucknowensis]|uniref:hypothetical protein n=1 Tax=Devosia lucknowensis TaxID=1096929 RepID=UPI000A37FA5E|nr:hypothetical protein [Devosia lucknowensis]
MLTIAIVAKATETRRQPVLLAVFTGFCPPDACMTRIWAGEGSGILKKREGYNTRDTAPFWTTAAPLFQP